MFESPQAVTGVPDAREATRDSGSAAAVALLVLAGVLWIVGRVDLQFANSDDLVPVFASLYHWTPFYWGQTRLGMPIPLLASPVQDPVANLMTQKAIGYALALLFPFLLARWLAGARRWILAGALGAATLVLALRPHLLHFFFVSQCYIASATPAVAGMMLVESGRSARRLAGGLLLAVAFWITPSTLLWLAPMVILRSLLPADGARAGRWPDRRLVLRLAWIGGLALALAWSGRLVPGVTVTPLSFSPVALWPANWGGLAGGALTRLQRIWPWWLAALALGIALAARSRPGSPGRAEVRTLGLALVAGASGQLLGAGMFLWVAQSIGEPAGWRYVIPSLVFALLLPPFAVALLWPATAGHRFWSVPSWRSATLFVLALVLTGLTLRVGLPSLARTRDALEVDARSGLHLDPFARELIERRATHLLAPYWLAYPMAFRANSLLYTARESRMVWPLAGRAESARSRWQPADWSTARIAVLRRVPETSGPAKPPAFELETDRRILGLPELERIEIGDLVEIYRGRSAAMPPG